MKKFAAALFGILGLVLVVGLMGLTFQGKNGINENNIPLSERKTNLGKVDASEINNTKISGTQIEEEEGMFLFQAVVISAEEKMILVEPLQEEWKQRLSDRVWISQSALDSDNSNKEMPKLQVGDWVQIVYNGAVMETYPTQLGVVYSISKVEEAIDIDTDTIIAEYRTNYVNMQLQLPSDWEYEIVPNDPNEERKNQTFGIRFWPKEEADFKLELFYWTEGIGMCGTGVTIEDIEFSNGMLATQYTEKIEERLWLTIIYQNLPGTYVVSGSIPEELWEKYQPTIIKILETAELGKEIIDREKAVAIASEVFVESISMPEEIYRDWKETKDASGFYDSVRAVFHWEEGDWEIKFYCNKKDEIREIWLDAEGIVLNKE